MSFRCFLGVWQLFYYRYWYAAPSFTGPAFRSFHSDLIRNAGSTSWPSDAIAMRKNQAFMNRSAEVRLVARRRTQRGRCTLDGRSPNETGSRRADIVDLRSRPHRGMTFPLLDPQCRPFPWRRWWRSRRGNSAISVGVRDNAMLPQRIPELELGTAAVEK